MKKTLFILTFISLFSCGEINSQSEAAAVSSEIYKSDIESHIYFLASDELKGRETGTPEIDIAAAYIANTLRRYKVKPIGDNGSYYQNIPLTKNEALKKVNLKIGSTSFSDFIPMNSVNVDFKGSFIFIEDSDHLAGKDVKGKVVVINSTSKNIRNVSRQARNLRNLARKQGAIAIVEFVKANESIWQQYKRRSSGARISYPNNEGPGIAHLWIQDDEGVNFGKLISGNLSGSLKAIGAAQSIVNSKNVVGLVEGNDPHLKEEYVIYSAHYDHVGIGAPDAQNDSIYNGARDNAVGTVTVLSAAKSIAKRPTKRSALFILFTGEEKGLLGSKWYVEHPVIPLNQMVFCFNSDNGGYNDTTLATIVGLDRTTEGDLIRKAVNEFGLKAINESTGTFFNRSDNVQFARKGIPAPTFSLGFTSFDEEIGKYYHQAADNPDNLDYDYLEQFFRAYVLSCRYIGNNTTTPFWTEGDFYYEAGKQLYNK